MSNPVYRSTTPQDLPRLKAIWAEAYNGDLSCANIYFDRYYTPGDGVVADVDGQLTSAIYLIDGYTLHIPGKSPRPCTYLYALGTPPRYRGMGYGGKTIWKSGVLAYDRGADFVCFLPASPSLYQWYQGCIGTATVFYRREFTVTAGDTDGTCTVITSEEYNRLRKILLQNTPHADFPTKAVALQGEYCRLYGGDLVRLQAGDAWGIGACDRDGDTLTFRELLFPNGDVQTAVRAVLKDTRTSSALCRTPAFFHPAMGRVVDDNVLVPGGYTFPKTEVPPWWGFSMD